MTTMNTCTACGHECRHVGEFHPHLFCVLKQAGRLDPWADFTAAVAYLGVSLPVDPPLVRDLPLFGNGAQPPGPKADIPKVGASS